MPTFRPPYPTSASWRPTSIASPGMTSSSAIRRSMTTATWCCRTAQAGAPSPTKPPFGPDHRRRTAVCSTTPRNPSLRHDVSWAVLRRGAIAGIVALLLGGCSNNPYPASERQQKILYSSFSEAPKTLDPAVAYTTASHIITGNVYDTLLEYHFLKRPYELLPALAESVRQPIGRPDGGSSYLFRIRDGIFFHSDPCFSLSQGGGRTRKVTAADFAFQLARLADPSVNSPLASSFTPV